MMKQSMNPNNFNEGANTLTQTQNNQQPEAQTNAKSAQNRSQSTGPTIGNNNNGDSII